MIVSQVDAARQRLTELQHGRVEQDRILADAEAKKKAEKEESERKHAERLATVANERLVVAKRAFLAAGGSEADWSKRKDQIAADIATQAAVNAGSAVHTGVRSLVDVRSI